jgi:ribosomal protein S6--L-glutamate ligase/gamma-F420-2:alpha-L-glutamate ligase
MGKDLRVYVIGGKVVACALRYNENDFRSNVVSGGSMKQIDVDEKYLQTAIAVCNYLEADFAGVDLLFGDNGPIVCEINSNPHFKSTLDCTGVDLSGYILEHIGRKLV